MDVREPKNHCGKRIEFNIGDILKINGNYYLATSVAKDSNYGLLNLSGESYWAKNDSFYGLIDTMNSLYAEYVQAIYKSSEFSIVLEKNN